MWINDLKKRIKVESVQANKSKPLAFSDELFACAERDKNINISQFNKQCGGLSELTPAYICSFSGHN